MSSQLVHAHAHRSLESRKTSNFSGHVARASRGPRMVRCWSWPTALVLGALTLMLSACMAGGQGDDGEAGGACAEQEVRMSVRGRVALPVQTQRSSGSPRKLWLSVYESSSVQCDGEFVQISAPGRQLLHTALDGTAFDLPVSFTTVQNLRDPWLELRVFEDSNGNGQCDDDELSGSAVSEADGTLVAPVQLKTLGCPGRA